MIKINYYVGCNDKDTLKQETPDSYFMTIFNTCFENFTVTKATGKFVNEKGLITTEKTFIITLLLDENDKDASPEWIEVYCLYLKHILNQESILVTKEVIQANFY